MSLKQECSACKEQTVPLRLMGVYVSSSDSVNWIGASTLNATWAMFIRLADT